jgi:hypothetical protein
MSWLSDLEEYAAKYTEQLRANNFYRVSSGEGPGMGAGIGYANRIFDIDLTNDRGYFIIYLLNLSRLERTKAGFLFRSKANFSSQRIDLGVILALLKATKNGKDFSELSDDEKPQYFNLDDSDPFARFFINLKDINELLKRTKPQQLNSRIESYANARGKWLFGPKAGSSTQEYRDRFPPTMFKL